MKRIKIEATNLKDAMLLTEKLHDGRFEFHGNERKLIDGDKTQNSMILAICGDGTFTAFVSQCNVSYSQHYYGEFKSSDAEYYIRYTDKWMWEIKPDLFEFMHKFKIEK